MFGGFIFYLFIFFQIGWRVRAWVGFEEGQSCG